MREQSVLKLQEYATEEQIGFFDRLRSGDDPVHEDAAQASFKESCGCEAPAGATYAEALAALGLREISTTAHNARTFDNNTVAAKEAATNGAFSRQEIIEVRQMTEEEVEYEGWPGAGDDTVLVLDDDTRVFASRDEEGNGPGVLFVRGKEQTIYSKYIFFENNPFESPKGEPEPELEEVLADMKGGAETALEMARDENVVVVETHFDLDGWSIRFETTDEKTARTYFFTEMRADDEDLDEEPTPWARENAALHALVKAVGKDAAKIIDESVKDKSETERAEAFETAAQELAAKTEARS